MTTAIDKLAKLAGRVRGSGRGKPKPAPPVYVFLLADHLDAALAIGEDLARKQFSWHGADRLDEDKAERDRDAMRTALKSIRALELTLMSRVLRAREHAEETGRRDARFAPVANLFVSGTVPLADAVADLGNITRHNFDTGDVTTVYLRTRGLLDADVGAPDEGSIISIPETFMVASRIPLSALMDLVAMFLDTLETHFDLFVSDTSSQDGLEMDETEAPPSEDPDADSDSSDEAGDPFAAAVARSVTLDS